MKRFGPTFHSIFVAGCAVLIYAAIVVLGAGCMLAHADQIQAHHHHGDGKASPPNSFCTWACQAASDTVAVVQTPVAVAWLVVEQEVVSPASHFLSSPSVGLHPRAPPTNISFSRG